MWLTTVLVMIIQFLILGCILGIVLFALLDWFRQDDNQEAPLA